MTEDDIETNIRVWLLEIFVGHLIGLQTDRDPVLIKKTFAAMANVARRKHFHDTTQPCQIIIPLCSRKCCNAWSR